jgi:hypothetical protein
MLTYLIYKQLSDLQRMCKIAHEAARSSLGADYNKQSVEKIYFYNRERLLDIIRELDLGHKVDWDTINGMFRTMESKE